MIKECLKHGEVKHFLRKDSNTYRCSKCSSEAVSKRRKELVIKAVHYKGGKCSICSYNKCITALEFHHIDPTTKLFGISDGCTRSWEVIKVELDKCILVCANCHRELHFN